MLSNIIYFLAVYVSDGMYVARIAEVVITHETRNKRSLLGIRQCSEREVSL